MPTDTYTPVPLVDRDHSTSAADRERLFNSRTAEDCWYCLMDALIGADRTASIQLNKAKRGCNRLLFRRSTTMGILSSYNVCLSPVTGGRGCRMMTSAVLRNSVRASILSARARHRMTDRPSGRSGRPSVLFLVGQFSMPLYCTK